MRNSKTSFTDDELTQIIALVRELEKAEYSKQKGIRAKLRRIGLYWSEVADGVPYTVANLKELFENGTLKLLDEEKFLSHESVPTKESEEKEATPIPAPNFSDDEIEEYKQNGFSGFLTADSLRQTLPILPEAGGVYVVIRNSETEPQFLEKGTGGFFKGKDPNVRIEELEANCVHGSKTVYIGKATNLRKRIGQLLRFGEGKNIGHWGGRLLWQLADSNELLIAWKETGLNDPREIEAQMIRQFVSIYGKRPFANLKD